MPNPKKTRKVQFFPKVNCFVPLSPDAQDREPVILKLEEMEAVRLKDLVGLDQEACAREMDISRQTFQLILDQARSKMAQALCQGLPLRILGGDSVTPMCRFVCADCGQEYDIRYAKDRQRCPHCASPNVYCPNKAEICRSWCPSPEKLH